MAAWSHANMVDRTRVIGCLVGAVLAFLAVSWWHHLEVAAWCSRSQRVPCRAPADFFVLITPVITLLGALLGAIVVAVAQRRTAGPRVR